MTLGDGENVALPRAGFCLSVRKKTEERKKRRASQKASAPGVRGEEHLRDMNHSDAVVPDARENGTNGLPYIPFSHTGMPAGFAILGGKSTEQSGRRYFPLSQTKACEFASECLM